MADKLFGVSLQDQRIKWLVVGALAAVLLAVIFWEGEAPPAAATASTATGARPGVAVHRSPTVARKASAKTAVKKSRFRPDVAAKPEDELEMTLKFNPFAPRPSLQPQLTGETTATDPQLEEAQQERAEKARALAVQQRLSEFKGQKVSVLLRNSDGASAALIGGRLVREGDIVDGIRVLSISTDGVVLEAVPPPQ